MHFQEILCSPFFQYPTEIKAVLAYIHEVLTNKVTICRNQVSSNLPRACTDKEVLGFDLSYKINSIQHEYREFTKLPQWYRKQLLVAGVINHSMLPLQDEWFYGTPDEPVLHWEGLDIPLVSTTPELILSSQATTYDRAGREYQLVPAEFEAIMKDGSYGNGLLHYIKNYE